jgi:hypothetical protein
MSMRTGESLSLSQWSLSELQSYCQSSAAVRAAVRVGVRAVIKAVVRAQPTARVVVRMFNEDNFYLQVRGADG